jgi:hypothetical protein
MKHLLKSFGKPNSTKTNEELFKEIFQHTELPYGYDGGSYGGGKTIQTNYRLGIRKNEHDAWLCNIMFSFDSKGRLMSVETTGEI